MQRVGLPLVIRAVANTDPPFVQIKFEQRSDSVIRMDIRTDLAEIFKADGIRFNKSIGEGFGGGGQLTTVIQTIAVSCLHRGEEVVACEVTVIVVFTDVIDRKASGRFQPRLFCGVLSFNRCLDGGTLLIGNIILIQSVERLSQFVLHRFGGLITEGVCQGAHTVFVKVQGNINVAHRRSPR